MSDNRTLVTGAPRERGSGDQQATNESGDIDKPQSSLINTKSRVQDSRRCVFANCHAMVGRVGETLFEVTIGCRLWRMAESLLIGDVR